MKKITLLLFILFSAEVYSQNKINNSTPEKDVLLNYSRKLLMGEKKAPLSNQKIVLKNVSTSKTLVAMTDKYGDFTFKNLTINSTYKMEIPIDTLLLKKPMKQDTSKNNFNIDFNPVEFPELAAFKNVIFEVGSENTNFDKSYYTIKWESVALEEGTKKGENYKLVLMKGKQRIELITYPVLDGENFESALKEYKEKIISYRSLLKGEKLYMAKSDGTIIKKIQKEGNSFVYELLPAELISLSKEKEIDPEFALKNFIGSTKSELVVTEDIYYNPNSSDIQAEALPKLDKMIEAMNKNKSVKLTISSHTDSRGDDASNLILSQSRAQKVMEYIISKGIDKSRLTAKGYGETQIKNRCLNGIDCSEAEHKLNRRTEFKFVK